MTTIAKLVEIQWPQLQRALNWICKRKIFIHLFYRQLEGKIET